MKRLRFGLDLDGVCYEWQRTAMYMLRTYRGYTRAQLPGAEAWLSWNWHRTVIRPEDEKWLWSEGVKLGLFRYGHLYPGTIKAVRELSEIVDVCIVTHRPKQAVPDTMAWLAYNQIPASEVHILSSEQSKSTVKCDFYLDDKLENVHEVKVNTLAVGIYLWDRPWNQGTLESGILRVKSWDEVVQLVKPAAPYEDAKRKESGRIDPYKAILGGE